MGKTAVVLMNLGGPDSPEAVKPFLFNLFNDKAIISAPNPIRFLLAKFISSKRENTAKDIYAHLGGKSPILEETKAQAEALEASLSKEHKVFIAMRYWHPFTEDVVKQVKAYNPDHIILLPLYPQYSTTTSESSVRIWKRYAQKHHLSADTTTICCYPTQSNFIDAHRAKIQRALKTIKQPYRVLFSAHGLPKKVISKGDPYQWQVEQTSKAVVDALAIDDLDWTVCYQSKVGPLEWIGPSTDDEIIRACNDKKAIVLIPIAFVSEHSETLVELDIEYKEMAHEHGCVGYYRVPTLSTDPKFIQALASICTSVVPGVRQNHLGCARICPEECIQCLCH